MNFVSIFLIIFQTFIEYFFFKFELINIYQINKFYYYFWIISYFYLFWSYSSSSFINPGIILKENNIIEEEFDEFNEKLYCEICKIYRPKRTYHCKKCNKCILVRDHHCSFIGNCIGIRNQKSFILFLISFLIHSIFTSFLLIYYLINFIKTPIIISLTFILFLNFLIFNIIILYQLSSQFKSLFNNQTSIEFLKENNNNFNFNISKYDLGSYLKNIKQRIGSKPLIWFLPIPNNEIPLKFIENPIYINFLKFKKKF